MFRFWIVCLAFVVPTMLGAQITPSVSTYDFGDLYSGSQTYVDIVFTNNTGKTQYLLTIDKPRDVYYIFSGKKLLPDSSIVIRFKVNNSLKGKFNYQVDVYFSDSNEPQPIYLKGTIQEVVQNSLTDCPDFSSNPAKTNNPLEFMLTIRVIDSITREPIPNAKVYLVERGELVGNYSTNNKGIIQRSVPLGLYYITAEKEPYQSNYLETYLNATRNFVEIELSKNPNQEEPELIVEVPEENPEEIEQPPVEEEPVEIVIDNTPEPEIVVAEPVIVPPLDDIPKDNLDPSYFKYSNITFILDASSSMNASGKMDLLRQSMIELVKILRPEDNITVLKYAAEVDLVLDHTSGDQKDFIIETIEGIRTSGSTAGGDAIKTAYRLNQETFKQDGNNLVIMITDGLFNKGAKDYDVTISENYKKYGTRFSVVGIKTTEYVSAHMEKIVALGGGDFIEIHNTRDAQTKLVNELRRTAYKGDSTGY